MPSYYPDMLIGYASVSTNRRKLGEDDLAMARALLKDPSIPVAQIAKRLGMSRATFYAYFPGARSQATST
jgi:AcrR family transcriptional regulator